MTENETTEVIKTKEATSEQPPTKVSSLEQAKETTIAEAKEAGAEAKEAGAEAKEEGPDVPETEVQTNEATEVTEEVKTAVEAENPTPEKTS